MEAVRYDPGSLSSELRPTRIHRRAKIASCSAAKSCGSTYHERSSVGRRRGWGAPDVVAKGSVSLSRRAGLPERLWGLGKVVGAPGQNEEEIRESIEVADDLRVGVIDEERAPLGAAADGAAHV